MLLGLMTIAFTLSAFINASSACGFGHYQPKLPKALKK
ncbi:MAG: cyclic lactone autoinducer peptide [Bacillota bacterium]